MDQSPKVVSLGQAQGILSRLAPSLKAVGYLTALYGSVLERGWGRDMDLLLVPFTPHARPDSAFRTIRNQWRPTEETEVGHGLMGTYTVQFVKDGLVMDVQVRETPVEEPI